MGHYLVVEEEIDPAERVTHTTVHRPVSAVNPETAVRISDAPINKVAKSPEFDVTVYELADDGTGRPMVYESEELEL